jgi:hypothetical protein
MVVGESVREEGEWRELTAFVVLKPEDYNCPRQRSRVGAAINAWTRNSLVPARIDALTQTNYVGPNGLR